MCSLVHDGAAGELVPVVVLVGFPLVALIALPLVVGFLLSLVADLALLRVLVGTLYFLFNQFPVMITGSRNDQIGQLSIVGVKILMADRALIVCLHAVLATGGGNLSDQVAVLVTGLNNYIIFVGDLILAISIPIEITTSLAFPIFLVARFGAGSRLGGNLFQVVGVRGRRHAAGDGNRGRCFQIGILHDPYRTAFGLCNFKRSEAKCRSAGCLCLQCSIDDGDACHLNSVVDVGSIGCQFT